MDITENTFQEFKELVAQENNEKMNIIIDMLEDYNLGLCHYFKDREITRHLMLLFDIRMTLLDVNKKLKNENFFNKQIAMDLNTLARNTWYFKKENGEILTGQDLADANAIYMPDAKEPEDLKSLVELVKFLTLGM